MNKQHSFFVLKVIVTSLVLPAILPTSFLGGHTSYSRNVFLQQIKSETETNETARLSAVDVSSETTEELSRRDVSADILDTKEQTDISPNSNQIDENVDGGSSIVDTSTNTFFKVTVQKFVNGVQATEANSHSYAFPMVFEIGSEQNQQFNLSPESGYSWNKILFSSATTTYTTHEILNSESSSSRVFTADGCATACPADFNHDGMIDNFDLPILLDNWGSKQTENGQMLLGDTDLDNDVDGADLANLLGSWGPCQSFKLDGYSWGSSLDQAIEMGPTQNVIPTFSESAEDQFVIVWNSSCNSQPQVPVCEANINLVKNGDFENKIVKNDAGWDIFNTNEGVDWIVAWFDGANTYEKESRPNPAYLEIQAGVNGWLSSNGTQHAELDSDWGGPESVVNNEPASVKIYQDIATIPGKMYKISYDHSARPGTAPEENMLVAGINDIAFAITTDSGEGLTNTNWSNVSYVFTADVPLMRLSFTDHGTPNSIGTLLDNVSFTCLPDGESVDDTNSNNNGDSSGDNEQGNQTTSSGKKKSSSAGGEVLGASTVNIDIPLENMTCSPYLNEYVKYGAKNNPEEVKKLQTFLNKFQGENLPITGYYGPMTRGAVNKFQLFHNMFVLRPWVTAGLMENENEPTGYVYKTTRRWINLLECPILGTPMPTLS